MLNIILSGNFAFLNHVTIIPALACLDDSHQFISQRSLTALCPAVVCHKRDCTGGSMGRSDARRQLVFLWPCIWAPCGSLQCLLLVFCCNNRGYSCAVLCPTTAQRSFSIGVVASVAPLCMVGTFESGLDWIVWVGSDKTRLYWNGMDGLEWLGLDWLV